jgi:hypothetical protein
MSDTTRSWVQLPHPDNASANYLQVASALVGSGVAVIFVDTNPDTVVIGPFGQVAIALDTGTAYQNTDGDKAWSLWSPGGGGGVGPGTLNTLAKFTPDGTHVGDSQITDDGTDVLANVSGGVTLASFDNMILASNATLAAAATKATVTGNGNTFVDDAKLYAPNGCALVESLFSNVKASGDVLVESTAANLRLQALAAIAHLQATTTNVDAIGTVTIEGATATVNATNVEGTTTVSGELVSIHARTLGVEISATAGGVDIEADAPDAVRVQSNAAGLLGFLGSPGVVLQTLPAIPTTAEIRALLVAYGLCAP